MRRIIFKTSCLLLIALCALRLLIPESASPEYDYTVKQIFIFLFPILLLAVFFTLPHIGIALKVTLIITTLFLAIPCMLPPVTLLPWVQQYMVSGCWVLGSMGLGIAFFMFAAQRGGIAQTVFCLLGSLALAFCAGETYFLCTEQAQDGIVNDSKHSKYASLPHVGDYGGNISTGSSGDFPVGKGKPYAEANRQLKFDNEMYDVLYSFDEAGRRLTPDADPMPQWQLMLFGCSYTFGYGLNDEETWAWNLAKDLGKGWKVENYSYNGFGPQQMLSRIEDGAVENTGAPHKAALFLAIEDQLRRNAGLIYKHSVHYELDGQGNLERSGLTTDLFNSKICALPKYMNGSQLARYLSMGLMLMIAKRDHGELEKTWLAIIKKSALLLKEKYNAQLTVLLWPDVEYLKAGLDRDGIPNLLAKTMLPEWERSGAEPYLIHPSMDWHPNAKASREIAKGLADYYRNISAEN